MVNICYLDLMCNIDITVYREIEKGQMGA